MGAAETEAGPAAADNGTVTGRLTLGELTSEELAWQAGRGCHASFAELVNRFAPRLQAFLRRRTHDRHEAEDLVQDTFLKAYRSLGQYDESWRFSTWLFTIATRTAVSHHRRRRPEVVNLDAEAAVNDEAVENREERENLWTLASRLPEGQYQALWLRYGEDMPIREIARVMGKSQVCVKVQLYRARMKLAKYLKDDDL